MRVICPECGQKACIQKSNRITARHADLYCCCCDPECGHTFVMNLSYSHTLSPSAKTTNQMVLNLCKALPPETRAELQHELSML
ncbi:ogr/Delta-like zinc finger family protein [Vibrio quintilis]|uniref:Ogr/Delta-like zinc finger n=1 Tax=Vibrio quintilis TaxID=1117707 RepID=A0A1M7YYU5_9VIBR|nr:ogr/Delta-like zinc finger family protein [Vibrio quintilis]SHO57867.1 Ogr/Delta-like zinc finger [Vibrio quintilis]